jgi:hypothetical protein
MTSVWRESHRKQPSPSAFSDPAVWPGDEPVEEHGHVERTAAGTASPLLVVTSIHTSSEAGRIRHALARSSCAGRRQLPGALPLTSEAGVSCAIGSGLRWTITGRLRGSFALTLRHARSSSIAVVSRSTAAAPALVTKRLQGRGEVKPRAGGEIPPPGPTPARSGRLPDDALTPVPSGAPVRAAPASTTWPYAAPLTGHCSPSCARSAAGRPPVPSGPPTRAAEDPPTSRPRGGESQS